MAPFDHDPCRLVESMSTSDGQGPNVHRQIQIYPAEEGTERQQDCVQSPWLSTQHREAEQGSDGCRQGSIGYDTFGMNKIAT